MNPRYSFLATWLLAAINSRLGFSATGREIGFVENFALADDRSAALGQLIPGTEEHFYYTALNLQNQGKTADLKVLLGQWAERIPNSPLRAQIEARQWLIDYSTDPKATLDWLQRETGLSFTHQRVTEAEKPNLPDKLDPATISDDAFWKAATAGTSGLENVNDGAVEELLASGKKLTLAQLRGALARLQTPAVPNLVALINQELGAKESQGFGSFAIHKALTLAQLEELRKLRPQIGTEQAFVDAWLAKLAPNPDEDVALDLTARAAWLDRLWAFARELPPAYNPLKAHLLFLRLELDRTSGKRDTARLIEYLKLPRPVPYVRPRWTKEGVEWRHPADLNQNFSAVTSHPPIGNDEPLVRDFLLRLFGEADAQQLAALREQVSPYLEDAWLKRLIAEARLLAGAPDAGAYASVLSPVEFEQLRQRVDLEFDVANRKQFGPEDEVTFSLAIKNAPKVLVKIFELNPEAYYGQSTQPIGTDIALDGLVPQVERTETVAEAPIRRVQRTFRFPELEKKRGLWVIEFVGNGRSSRALIRKGDLNFITRSSVAGTAITVLDEAFKPIPAGYLTYGGKRYDADKSGEIVIPFSAQPGPQPVVLHDGTGFASLETVPLLGEDYALKVGVHIERESLIAGRSATIAVRPSLRLNEAPASVALLQDVRLVIRSTNLDGTPTTRTISDVKLEDGREFTQEIAVPDRLATLSVELRAKVRSVSKAADIELAETHAVAINDIDKTEHVSDLYFGRDAAGWFVEERGKNGEPRADRAVTLVFRHRDYRPEISVSLKTNAEGRIPLGNLEKIASFSVTNAAGLRRDQNVIPDSVGGSGVLHGRAGQLWQLPLPLGGTPSLLEERSGTFVKDWTANVAVREGTAEIKDLPAGDYLFTVRGASRSPVRLKVTAGQPVRNFLISPARMLEASQNALLNVPNVALDNENITIYVTNASALTRVHVVATRFEPAFTMTGDLAHGFGQYTLLSGQPASSLSQFVSGRNLGDEYRYILERRTSTHFPGVMLERPGLLLNPWAVRDTNTDRQDAQAGDKFQRLAEARRSTLERKAGAAAANKPASVAPGPPSDPRTMDFLARQAVVSYNLAPDKDGRIVLKRSDLGHATELHVLAVGPGSYVARTVTVPTVALETRDLRLAAAALDPQKHFAQQDEVTLLPADKPFVIEDALGTKFEAYEHLGGVFSLLQTLSGDATLPEFAFIVGWPTYDAAKKRELYSKYACHELSFFLSRKDPEFFKAVIQPYLANKKDKTFLDEYLLAIGAADVTPLKRYIEPWKHGQLNIVERILLGHILPDQIDRQTRSVRDLLALVPPSLESDRKGLESALWGGALFDTDADDYLEGRSTAARRRDLRGMMEEKQMAASGGLGGVAAADAPAAPPAPAAATAAPAPSARFRGGQDKAAKKEMADSVALAELASDAEGLVAEQSVAFGMAGYAGADGTVELAKRKQSEALSFFRQLPKTKEWAENNYWHRLIGDQNANLITVSRFWADFAAAPKGQPFVSTHITDAGRNFHEIMMALAILDLPFPSQAKEAESKLDGVKLTLTPKTPLLLFHQAIKPAEVDAAATKLLVSQNFYRQGDRYIEENGEKRDKFVTQEFVAGTAYGCQIVVTNPTSSVQKLDVLFQIPAGARPVAGAKATTSLPVRLEPFHTQTLDFAFYFPKPGSYAQFPVHIASGGKTVAFAPPATLKVVDRPTVADTQSWAYVSQHATEAEVLAFLDQHNIAQLDLDKIAWRVRTNVDFYRQIIGRLRDRRIYSPVLYSYAIFHNDEATVSEWLKFDGRILAKCGPSLQTRLVTLDPVERGLYEQLEYNPLVNARAHRLGGDRSILNDRFREQYQRFLTVLSCQPSLSDTDRLALTYYLLLQDRIDEALAFFSKVKRDAVPTAIQYDYAAAWLAMVQEDTKAARATADKYAAYPVDRWKDKFAALVSQIDEIEGKGPKVTTKDDRDQSQDALAAKQTSFEVKVEGPTIKLTGNNLAAYTVNYYLMDLEFLFSTNPFVGQDSGRFAQIKPNATEQVKVDAVAGPGTLQHALKAEFQNKNVLVEVVMNGQRHSQAVYANELKVTVTENYGQIQVRHATDDRPLGKVYVKVYADVNGQPRFYKDGYTDLRGKFDYASLSTDELGNATRFSILVLSDSYGAVVREAQPPKQ